MANPQVQIGGSQPIDEGDIEMEGGNDGAEVIEVGESGAAGGATEEEEKPAQRVTFVEYATNALPGFRLTRYDQSPYLQRATATSNLRWSNS